MGGGSVSGSLGVGLGRRRIGRSLGRLIVIGSRRGRGRHVGVGRRSVAGAFAEVDVAVQPGGDRLLLAGDVDRLRPGVGIHPPAGGGLDRDAVDDQFLDLADLPDAANRAEEIGILVLFQIRNLAREGDDEEISVIGGGKLEFGRAVGLDRDRSDRAIARERTGRCGDPGIADHVGDVRGAGSAASCGRRRNASAAPAAGWHVAAVVVEAIACRYCYSCGDERSTRKTRAPIRWRSVRPIWSFYRSRPRHQP